MRGALIALTCAGVGCGFPAPAATGSDDVTDASDDGPPPNDASIDASDLDGGADSSIDATMVDATPDGPPALCFGTAFRVCETSATASLALAGVIDTGTDARCSATATLATPNGATINACIVTAGTITFAGNIRAIGTRPLVIYATAAITSTSMIVDASSYLGVVPALGAGATTGGACNATAPNPAGNAGGQGGSFAYLGGKGGDGTISNSVGVRNATPTPPIGLRGGCTGTTGANQGSVGGAGGGAVALVAPTITLTTTAVLAHGAGAPGTTATASDGHGGGGGGSGGSVVIEAQTLTMTTAQLGAQGGGGAEASRSSAGFAGGNVLTFGVAALGGGDNSPSGGNGGDGGVDAAGVDGHPGAIGTGNGGGGGGGGSPGFIYVEGVIMGTGATLHPPASAPP